MQTENKRILRLQYALKWIAEAWDAEDSYDRVIGHEKGIFTVRDETRAMA